MEGAHWVHVRIEGECAAQAAKAIRVMFIATCMVCSSRDRRRYVG